jgi:hypothetical protein
MGGTWQLLANSLQRYGVQKGSLGSRSDIITTVCIEMTIAHADFTCPSVPLFMVLIARYNPSLSLNVYDVVA